MMNRTAGTMVIVLSVLLFGRGCTDTAVNTGGPHFGQIIFEKEYVNYAWGRTWSGLMIDEQGAVYSFDLSEDPSVGQTNKNGLYSKEELAKKFQSRDSLLLIVSPDTLQRMRQLASSVDASSYSDTLSGGADMGEWKTSVYILQDTIDRYQRIVLQCEGDRIFFNTSVNARTLSEWIKRVR